jgi:tRNA dimethylallyltransferase
MKSKGEKLIVVLGPTASGKSNLGVFLAKIVNGEIISADSRQIYKSLDIGSGKISTKEMNGIKHYCLNIANPKKIFTAYNYKQCAQKAIKEIWQKSKIPIIVGGTGFYIDAALGRIKLADVPPNLKLRKKLLNYSHAQLFNLLKKLNPKRTKNIDRNNKVKLIRAIEISNRPPQERTNYRFEKIQDVRPENILWIGIKRSPENLKKRIHNRLLQRLQGITKEVSTLHKKGLTWKRFFDLGLEYRYVSLYLRGKLKKDEMIKKLGVEINKYAKRQMTYFKRNKEIHWIKNSKKIEVLVKKFL